MTDLVLYNGKIWTGDPASPWAEAVAVSGDRIRAVGGSKDIGDAAGRRGPEPEKVDLGGKLVLPGFFDCHTHFLFGGFALTAVKLRDASTREEFVRRIAAKALELGPGRWMTNGDWDEEWFVPAGLPARDWIDSVTAENPVCVNRFDSHMVLANSLALKLAGISRATPDPTGGEIVRDPATGEPTGILKDAAMDLVLRAVPPHSLADKVEAAQRALRHAAENGVTSVHEMADASSLEVYQEIERGEGLPIRISVYIPITEAGLLAALRLKSPFGGPRLKIGGLKAFSDGSIGSSTACFFEPYADDPSNRGLFNEQMFPEGIMEERLMVADKAGLQAAVHAIGDRANRTMLDIFERIAAADGPRDRRWRIEHAQHLSPSDIARFGRLGVIASVQPAHLMDDGCSVERKIGAERCATTYPFRSLLDAGARLVFGSDWTVAEMSPVLGICAAVARRTVDGKNPGGWHPEQKITVEEAVRAYTVDAAFAEFAEREKGSVRPGLLADLAVLDRDIFETPAEEIAEAKVVMTVAGGKIVHRRG